MYWKTRDFLVAKDRQSLYYILYKCYENSKNAKHNNIIESIYRDIDNLEYHQYMLNYIL